MSESQDTYTKPKHGWTCFHCGETFTTIGAAATHFGATPDAVPGCVLKVSMGAERGLLMAVRRAEQECQRAWRAIHDETTDVHEAMRTMQSRHADELLNAEESGYARGLRDGNSSEELVALRARVAELERANVSLAEEAQRMKSALRFYAHQQHVIDFHGELVEGWLNQTDRTKEAIVEPGRYALWALLGKRIDWEGEEPPEHPEELRMIGA